MQHINFLDLFSGAGGLSEGFIQAGFSPIAHVECDSAACYTLKTRTAYHWLKEKGKFSAYEDYINNRISREDFYKLVPSSIMDGVINVEICDEKINHIYSCIDNILDGNKLDLIIGGPPCQAYSIVGRSRDKNKMLGDKRNYLFIFYADFLKKYKPKYFVFENVLGLLSAKDINNKSYLNSMRELFLKAGYQTEYQVISAEKYGVPQSRKRIILVGKLGSDTDFYPKIEENPAKVNISNLFSDIPLIKSGEGSVYPQKKRKESCSELLEKGIASKSPYITWHIARPHTPQDLDIYKIAVNKWNNNHCRLDYNSLPEKLKTHRQRKAFLDRFKVVAGDLPYSHTVVAHISKDGHYYIHPDINQNRSLTPREVARLQTFPDDYHFESVSGKPSRTAAFKQIGNAVPVLLARNIAEKIKDNW
ncbi:DNA cytosine methyltransferase [Hafnia paralvei]|uniref:DNA cytosine methyltransferase n=1 Tax=Hafnia paralvei TaxID=546367 RepID=UPI0024BB3222|nr:DNA cytosine methyltransferase [Hafnia paralvei]